MCVAAVERAVLRGRRISQEYVVELARVGVSSGSANVLEKVGYIFYFNDTYFVISEKVLQLNKNPELFGSFVSLFWACNLQVPNVKRQRNCPHFFRVRRTFKIPARRPANV